MLLSSEPDTIVFPSGEKATERMKSLWAFFFSLFSSIVAAGKCMSGQIRQHVGDFGPKNAPESQTLMLLSQDPDTIVFPSGAKATEAIGSLCALLFSLFSSSVAAWEGGAGQI